jgi:hypothetical protein
MKVPKTYDGLKSLKVHYSTNVKHDNSFTQVYVEKIFIRQFLSQLSAIHLGIKKRSKIILKKHHMKFLMNST